MKRVLPASFTTTNNIGLSYQDDQKLTKNKTPKIDEAFQRYQELSEYSSATPAQFINLVLDIQHSVNEGQPTEETMHFAMGQLNHLFPNISNLDRAEELILILENLAVPDSKKSMTIWRDDSRVTLGLNKLLKQLERLDRDRKPVFDLLPKDVEPELLAYLDSESLRAMRLVSKVACDRASGKLTSQFIDFNCAFWSMSSSHLFEYYENLNLPSVSIKIQGLGLNEMGSGSRSVISFSEFMERLSKNKKIGEIKLDVSSGYSKGYHRKEVVVMLLHAISKVPAITELNISNIDLDFIKADDIAGMPKLTRLIIAENNLGPDSAEQLAKLTNLTTLDVSDNNLDSGSAEHLTKLTNLTTLDISCNNFDSEDVDHVAKLTNLTTLNISSYLAPPICKERLAKLTNLTSLTIW